jgi:hypothetical protein
MEFGRLRPLKLSKRTDDVAWRLTTSICNKIPEVANNFSEIYYRIIERYPELRVMDDRTSKVILDYKTITALIFGL